MILSVELIKNAALYGYFDVLEFVKSDYLLASHIHQKK